MLVMAMLMKLTVMTAEGFNEKMAEAEKYSIDNDKSL